MQIYSYFIIQIGIFFELHDFDFSFQEKNYLGKRIVNYDSIRFILITLSISINHLPSRQVMYCYMLTYGIIKTSIGLKFQSFKQVEIQKLYIVLSFFYTSMAGSFTIYEMVDQNSSFFIYLLISSSLSIQMGILIFNHIEEQFIQNYLMIHDVSTLNDYIVDKLVRIINNELPDFYKNYVSNGYGILFEAVHAHHIINCQNPEGDCFCKRFNREHTKLDQEECGGQEYRYEFMQSYIMHLIEQYIQTFSMNKKWKNQKNITYLYICYLTDVMKIPTKSYWHLYTIKMQYFQKKSQLKLIDLYIITSIEEEMKLEFKYLFENSTIPNQRINMIGAIDFDDKFQNLITTLKHQLLSVGQLYDFLCSNLIKLHNLESKSILLERQNQQILNLIQDLFNLNPFNINLQYISSLYVQVLDLENRKITTLQKHAIKSIKDTVKIQNKSGIKHDISDDIFFFGDDSCVIYASLISPNFNITKASSTFSDLFCISSNLILGKPVNAIIPSFFHDDHSIIIKNFLQSGELNAIRQGEIFVFAQDKGGFIFPVKIKLKIESLDTDFGVCAAIKKIDTHKEYVFFEENGRINNISIGLTNILNHTDNINQMNIYEIIPLLHAIQQAGEINEAFSTIMIPYEKDNYQYLKKYSNNSFHSIDYNLNSNNDQYTISFRYKKFQSSFLQNEGYNYIEIENISRERNIHRKNLQIKILSRSLKKIFEDTNLQANLDGEQGSGSPRSPQMLNKLRTRIVNTIMKNIIDKNKETLDKDTGYNQSKSLNKQSSVFTKQASLSSFMNQNVRKKSTITLQQVSQHDGNETVSDEESAVQINSNSMHYTTVNHKHQEDVQSTRRIDQSADQSNYQFFSTANHNFEESMSSHREILSPPFCNNNISIQNLLDASNQFQNETFTSRRLNELPSPQKNNQINKFPLFNKHEENKIQKPQKKDKKESGFFNIVTILKNKKDSEPKYEKKDQKILNKSEQNLQQSSRLISMQELSTNFHQQSTLGLELESPTLTIKQQNSNKKVKLPNEKNEDQNKGKLQLAAYQSNFHDNLDMHRKSSECDLQASDLYPKDALNQRNQSSRKFDEIDEDNQYQNSEDLAEDQKNEIASVNSSKFSQAELSKRIIISHIKSANANSGLVFMLYTGVLSFFVITILSFILSNKGYSSLMDYKNDYNKLDIAVGLLIDVLDVIKTKSFGDLAKVDGIFGDKDDNFDQQQKKIADEENVEQINDYLEKLNLLLNDIHSEQQLNKLTKEITEVQMFTQFDTFIDQKSSFLSLPTKQPLNFIEFIHFFYEQIFQYFIKFQPQYENNFFENIENFHTQMVELQKIIETEVQDSFDSMENQQITIIVIILAVSSVMVLIVVPISIFVKIQKEEIYKLVGSFNPQHLQNQIDNIESILHKLEAFIFSQFSQKELKQDINFKINKQMKGIKTNQSSPNINSDRVVCDYQEDNQKNQLQNNQNQMFSYISRVSNKRNRTIASFSSIKKINYFLIIGLFFVVGIIMIQPSLNYIILTPFLEEQKVVLKERVLILDITSQLIRNQAPNYQNIWMILKEDSPPNDSVYYDFIKNQTSINLQQMNRIQQLLANAKVPRRNQYEYNEFYLKIMNDNICEVKKNYPHYFNYTKQDNECETLFSGIFKRGFLITLQHSYQQFSLFEELYKLKAEESIQQILAIQKQMQFYQLHQTIKLLSKTVKSIKLFQDSCNQEYVNYIIKTFFTLFVVQIILVSIIFSLGWSFLFKIFTRELQQSKQIFNLFHINILYQNQFITKYLKQKQSLLQY